jgi:hypothetical protein
VPPEKAASAVDLKAFVATNPGAIGYLDTTDVDDSVKVVQLK